MLARLESPKLLQVQRFYSHEDSLVEEVPHLAVGSGSVALYLGITCVVNRLVVHVEVDRF